MFERCTAVATRFRLPQIGLKYPNDGAQRGQAREQSMRAAYACLWPTMYEKKNRAQKAKAKRSDHTQGPRYAYHPVFGQAPDKKKKNRVQKA